MKRIDFNTKEMMIKLAGTCFWFWKTFYSFLDSCEISPSVYLQFGKEGRKYQVMRSLLELLERQEKYDLITNICMQFYNLSPSDDGIDITKAKKLLDEFRSKVGSSIIQDAIKQREAVEKIEARKNIIKENLIYKNKILQIKNEFLVLHTYDNKQMRGYAIERLLFDILALEELEYKPPYKTNGEQIDGYFKFDKFDYLVETKWTEEISGQNELSIFDGKIRGKAQSTRGFILSINGFSQTAINKYSGDSPRIILMDGQDLMAVLEERITFYDLMKFKSDIFVRKGEIYVKFSA
jgi:hypothetical protein